ncbi:MAG: ATP-binding protein [Synergistaceae bacterium]|jgi:predicted AAA+ superfamily ATPase|nr:ATP-binding protein [Synergistaceae bacterium]
MNIQILPRWQHQSVLRRLENRRVVILSGARQSGKTTLAHSLNLENSVSFNLDVKAVFASAQSDPEAFVTQAPGRTMIIDEVQKAPDLIPAIKVVVDKNPQPGQFLLTGSVDVRSKPEIKESLAGRIGNIRVRPLSVGESLRLSPGFFDACLSKSWSHSELEKKDYFDLALAGGYPEAILKSPVERYLWHLDYLDALLLKDLKNAANIRRADALKETISILAAWSSKLMDKAAIGALSKVSRNTFNSYLSALKLLYLFDEVSFWSKTDYDRVGRQTKAFCNDSGLMASLLNWNLNDVAKDSDKAGKLIETFVHNQLCPLIELRPHYDMFHYRDRYQREIDFIVKSPDAVFGIEVKTSSSVDLKAAKQLRWFREHIVPGEKFVGIVLYTGKEVLPFGQDCYAVPMAALWQNT